MKIKSGDKTIRNGSRRRQGKPPSACFGIDEVDQLAPQLLGFSGRCERRARHFRGKSMSQCAFLLDLPHRATDPVDVIGSELTLMGLHPGQQVALRVEAFAVHEDSAQARARALCQICDALCSGTVTAAGKRKVDRQPRARDPVRFNVAERGIVQHRQPCKMQALELPERQNHVRRVGHVGLRVHRLQQFPQAALSARRDLCHQHELGLRRHGGERSSLKLHD
jgi:hypothetical protein